MDQSRGSVLQLAVRSPSLSLLDGKMRIAKAFPPREVQTSLEREKVLAGEGVGSDAHSLRLGGRVGKQEAEADPLMYDGVAGSGLETPLIRIGEEQGRAFFLLLILSSTCFDKPPPNRATPCVDRKGLAKPVTGRSKNGFQA